MTHEEAARILNPETSLEALCEIEYYGGFRGEDAVLEAVNEACRIAAETLRQSPPAHIDREALCGLWEGEADGYADGELVYDVWRCGDCGHVEETDDPDLLPRFCPDCGRAMTTDAWTELEKRLRRCKE